MKNTFACLLAALLAPSAILLLAAPLAFTYTRTLSDTEQRGVVWATAQYNAQRRAADTNSVNLTPRQYLTARIDDLIESYNRSADEATAGELSADLETLRSAYIRSTAARRSNILNTVNSP